MRGPMGMYKVPSLDPIAAELDELDIVPTKEGRFWFLSFEADCSELPKDLPDKDVLMIRTLCQFAIDISWKKKIAIRSETEYDTWRRLFDAIGYAVSLKYGYLKLLGRKPMKIAS